MIFQKKEKEKEKTFFLSRDESSPTIADRVQIPDPRKSQILDLGSGVWDLAECVRLI
jgi:hypothetical protein